MKIILISILTPYKENYKGTSALPYHLMIHRNMFIGDKRNEEKADKVDIEIYTFNNNQLPKEKIIDTEIELGVKIHCIPLPYWYIWIFRLHLLFIRIFLKYPIHNYITVPQKIVKEINSKKPDGIWIYGEELSRVSKQLSRFCRVHTLPDCESLYYYRMLGKRFAMRNKMRFWRSVFMYPKFLNMEKQFDTSSNIHYHLVGEADVKFLKEIAPNIQAHFLRHPHYQLAEPAKIISFSSKIKLLIAGQYNLYMQQDVDELIDYLCAAENRAELSEHYVITFLGKGWELHVDSLIKAEYEVYHTMFAPNYIDEIVKHDIQITPITIGTGTKGKVLDAIANGLLVIGSWHALENIAVEHSVSCLQYKVVKDVICMLKKIYLIPYQYETIAYKGRQAILEFHDRSHIAQQMYSLF